MYMVEFGFGFFGSYGSSDGVLLLFLIWMKWSFNAFNRQFWAKFSVLFLEKGKKYKRILIMTTLFHIFVIFTFMKYFSYKR